jgi:hypothetical protein
MLELATMSMLSLLLVVVVVVVVVQLHLLIILGTRLSLRVVFSPCTAILKPSLRLHSIRLYSINHLIETISDAEPADKRDAFVCARGVSIGETDNARDIHIAPGLDQVKCDGVNVNRVAFKIQDGEFKASRLA